MNNYVGNRGQRKIFRLPFSFCIRSKNSVNSSSSVPSGSLLWFLIRDCTWFCSSFDS